MTTEHSGYPLEELSVKPNSLKRDIDKGCECFWFMVSVRAASKPAVKCTEASGEIALSGSGSVPGERAILVHSEGIKTVEEDLLRGKINSD